MISRREFLSKSLKISLAAATAMLTVIPLDFLPLEDSEAEAFVTCCYRNCYANCHSNRGWR
jgi:hypothetical protein